MEHLAAGPPEALFDRAAGTLLGLACGDALGAPWEGGDPPDGPLEMSGGRLWAPGEWTDDTRMAICIVEAAAEGSLDPEAVGERFCEWFRTDAAGIGRQTHAVLSRASGPGDLPRLSAEFFRRHPEGAAGNGSLMRTAPVALAHLGDDEAIAGAAREVSDLTHGDPVCAEACVLWCIGVDRAVREARLDGVREGLELLDGPRRDFWSARLDEAEREPPRRFRPNGYVVTPLQAAWAAVRQIAVPEELPGRHLEYVIEAAVRIGHDTDTVGAIAGSLAGARWGSTAVPMRWREVLHGWPAYRAGELVRLACLAANRGAPVVGDWPLGDRMHAGGARAPVELPDDPGVLLGDAMAAEATEADAIVSLCRMGRGQVRGPGHHELLMWDFPDEAWNPNLELLLRDTAEAIARWRDEGRTVLVHCAAGVSRSPTVAAAYLARRLGISGIEALRRLRAVYPDARPNPAFMRALGRL